MIQTRDRSTLLKKLNPGSKLWLSLGLILSNLFFKNWYYSLGLIILSFVMIVLEKQFGVFKFMLVTILIGLFTMNAIHGSIAPIIDKVNDPVLFRVFGIPYYEKGFAYAARYFFRFAPMMSFMFLIFKTLDMADLAVVMCNVGFPYKFVFTFIYSFQVIILLNKEMDQIKDAQRARGLNMEGNLIQRFKAFIPIIVPVVATSIVKVQDQAIAMDTKGFNSECKKTVYREVENCVGDYIVKALGIFLTVAAIAYVLGTSFGVIPSTFSNII